MQMWRIVLDTSVMVAALRSRHGASAALLGLVADRVVVPLVTMALFLEYEEVLKRPAHLVVMGKTPTGWMDFYRPLPVPRKASISTFGGAHKQEIQETKWWWRPR